MVCQLSIINSKNRTPLLIRKASDNFKMLEKKTRGKVVIYSQDLGYSMPGLRILNPDNLVLGFIFKDPES